MKKKILIASLFATIMLLVPMTSVVGVNSDVSLNRKIEKIEDNNTITETYDNEDCGCQDVNRYDLFRVKLLLVRLEVYINIILLKFGHIPELTEKCEEILDVINSNRQLNYPTIICGFLFGIILAIDTLWTFVLALADGCHLLGFHKLGDKFDSILDKLGEIGMDIYYNHYLGLGCPPY